MKMLTVTRVAAVAVGLSLAAGQAFADPSDGRGRGPRNDNASEQQNTNDQGDRDHKKKDGPKTGDNPGPVVAPVQPTILKVGPVARDPNPNRVGDNRRGRNDQANDRNRNYGNNNDRRNWGNQDRRPSFDVSRYQRNFAATHRYRVGSYRPPYGYSYRRYSYGQHLPRNYYVRNFWLADFLMYGLFAPPPGYVWVRYGPDALLIDEETGEIVQVRYDMFYS